MRFLGGSVVGRNLAVSFCGGSSLHFDQGYDGDLQWVFSIQDEDSDHAILWEGSNEADDMHFTSDFRETPKVYNMTSINTSINEIEGSSSDIASIKFQDNGAGVLSKSILVQNKGLVIEIEKTDRMKGTPSKKGTLSFGSLAHLENNDTKFIDNIFYSRRSPSIDNTSKDLILSNGFDGNKFDTDPLFDGNPTTTYSNPFINASSNAVDSNYTLPFLHGSNKEEDFEGFWNNIEASIPGLELMFVPPLVQTKYRGSFSPGENWLEGWTKLDSAGYVQRPVEKTYFVEVRTKTSWDNSFPDTEDYNESTTGKLPPYPSEIFSYPVIQRPTVQIGPPKYYLFNKKNSGSDLYASGYFDHGKNFVINAKPAYPGFKFVGWTGDMNTSSEWITMAVTKDLKFTANYESDLADDDEDGISNYQELVLYETDPTQRDSDNDGVWDFAELELGTDPNKSLSTFLEYAKHNGLIKELDSFWLIQTGRNQVVSSPSAYNLVTKSSYDQMVQDLIASQNANAPHYTEGWFYLPSRGWMWTNRDAYPYFYDSEDKDWMYFQSGEEKPKFYRYKTKVWLTIE